MDDELSNQVQRFQKIPHMGFHNLTLFEDGGSADVGETDVLIHNHQY